ncbi:DUF917 domain-containing protein [Agromyces aerolatus]|uniref:DUF917 domain-containing protein n=1 Tax=Agromyces sp. LY-1074 TaxID=3074080 RepID=UPI00285C806B|nr:MULTISPECIES: DUF917 domain-containing protein [unclassified Agromyces]MDR5701130.1 DUF917 domain-containing protein [Agromyces sp. LY-1074]MDR5707770.1 DUF917 domain-containing protein [Agromyces sp. LY-1358]
MSRRPLEAADIEHLCTGAMFVACTVEHSSCLHYRDLALELLGRSGRAALLCSVDELDPEARTASLGFVNKGLLPTEMIPVGDEFPLALSLLEDRLGESVQGIFPLAAASVNAMVPVYVAMQIGLPVIDADPMGRVFPLVSQTTLALAGLSAGPVGLTGPTGETAIVGVSVPDRAERLIRALAAEFGGWAATASYPVSADDLARHGVQGSMSRLIEIGEILHSSKPTQAKYAELSRLLGIRKVIRARVADIEGLSRPTFSGLPDRPFSVTLVDEAQGRIVRLEIQNEILMMLVDGSVQAIVPDIITMVRPEGAGVASLEDLWIGNKLDLISFPAAPQWYSPAGRAMVEPMATHVVGATRGRDGT